jgi:hypothetical protein
MTEHAIIEHVASGVVLLLLVVALTVFLRGDGDESASRDVDPGDLADAESVKGGCLSDAERDVYSHLRD